MIYPILDLGLLAASRIPGADLAARAEAFARTILVSDLPLLAIQVRRARAGGTTDRDFLAAAQAVMRASDAVRALPVFVNDRPDIAEIAGAAGVHLGRTDLPPEEVRACFPNLLLGFSSHTPAEFRARLADRPNLLAYGPIFSTTTKTDAEPVVGLGDLPALSREAHPAGVVSVAIGGITTSDRAMQVIHAGAGAAAVVSGLLPAGGDLSDVRAALSDFRYAACRSAYRARAIEARA